MRGSGIVHLWGLLSVDNMERVINPDTILPVVHDAQNTYSR